MTSQHILLVDDEPALVRVLQPVLEAAGYRVTVAADAGEALARLDEIEPDIMLLDLGLPDMDGKELIRTVQANSDLPIIVISARHQEAEKIAALDGGAVDYVDKPFEIGELMARIRVACRKRLSAGASAARYRSGPLEIDFPTRTVTLEGEKVRLSPKEYTLLNTLARRAGQVVTHKQLLAAGWGQLATDTQYLRVYIGLLRQKIEEDAADPRLVLTEPGVGYRLVAGS